MTKRTVRPLSERFWEKVNKDPHPRGCWLWVGGKDKAGYGMVNVKDNRLERAHRISYVFAKGEIPDVLCVCHACDNPACVNPDHLWLGTHGDNSRDKMSKGRGNHAARDVKRGERNPSAKLSADQVSEILSHVGPMRVMAEKHGVSTTHIWRIRHGASWNHVSRVALTVDKLSS